jgi:hypothetical protein
MKEKFGKIVVRLKDRDREKTIKGKIRMVKQSGNQVYDVVPRLLDEALTRWIKEHK